MTPEIASVVEGREPEARGWTVAAGLIGRLERLTDGDAVEAQWLYDRFAPTLHRRLRGRYPDLETDDLVHDAFVLFLQRRARVLRAFVARWAAAPSPCGEADLERHLWDLACGLASNRRRSAWRQWTVALPASLASRASGIGRVEARDSLERLERCLGDGPPRTYLYFQLRYRDGLRPAEIAQATGWGPKAVYKLGERFQRALARCVERLGLRRRT